MIDEGLPKNQAVISKKRQIGKVSELKALWSNAIDPSEQNREFRLLIDRIVYDRKDDGLRLDVLYK
ncbi:hypothetical protein SOV_09790 [Sporomusa ovata DSM 2662]|uniref:Uncharacterized protein n=1 Tax=Sporomusa ovata TaxID=2378 RepID=A0A0U1KXZ5_9FIRM|nr:hypothetical protein [Sporomusa ovata]EQB28628.1 hypothetical protein SOV_1c03170 [Sporomusa ovata DSM 2662]CQR72135.1 hypothetical protein SpAn4DRAFT_5024 [Sporomusa ovata]